MFFLIHYQKLHVIHIPFIKFLISVLIQIKKYIQKASIRFETKKLNQTVSIIDIFYIVLFFKQIWMN